MKQTTLECPGVDGKTILKWNLEENSVGWIELAPDGGLTAIKLRVPKDNNS
jgi:hypothetical protein